MISRQPARRLGQRRGRRRQADALEAASRQFRQTFQAQGQIRAALARGQGVYLIDHDPAQADEQLPSHRLTEKHGHALRRRQQDVRRMSPLLAPFRCRRIAAAHRHTRKTIRRQHRAQFLKVREQRALGVRA